MANTEATYNPLPVSDYRIVFSNPEITKQFQEEIAETQERMGFRKVTRQLGKYIRMTDYYSGATAEKSGQYDTVYTGIPGSPFRAFTNRRGVHLRLHTANRLQDFQSLSATLSTNPSSLFPYPRAASTLTFAYTFPTEIADPFISCETGFFSKSRFGSWANLASTAVGFEMRGDRATTQFYYKHILEQTDHRAPRNFVFRVQGGSEGFNSSWLDYKFRVSTQAKVSQRLRIGKTFSQTWPMNTATLRLQGQNIFQWASKSPFEVSNNRSFAFFRPETFLARFTWSSFQSFGPDFGRGDARVYPYLFHSLLLAYRDQGRSLDQGAGVGMDVSLSPRVCLRGLANLWRGPTDQQFQLKVIYTD